MNDYTNDIDVRAKIAESIECDIDDYCERTAKRWKSRRLGSSAIGKSCSRQIWYAFRWATEDVFGSPNRPAGRVFRLFNRGHREEPELQKYLEGIGCRFVEPPEGKDQHSFSGVSNHAVTKLDGIAYLPERFKVTEPVMIEMKTANLSYFNQMQKKGIQIAQPSYWDQVHFSGALSGLKYVLFVVSGKNDDNIHIEFHKLDEDHGKMLLDKAEYVITASPTNPPLKIAQSATNFACKYCQYADICHNGDHVEKNCRSCVYSEAAENGKWNCVNPSFTMVDKTIPADTIPKGCDFHVGIS